MTGHKLLIFLALLFSSSVSLAQILDYDVVREMAMKQEESSPPEYIKELTEFYTALAVDNLPRCAEELGNPDPALISVVAKIGPEGQVIHHGRQRTCLG